MDQQPGTRRITLNKLSVPYEKGDDPLTEKEVWEMVKRGTMRAAHSLWLAERYMMDLSKLGYGPELDSHLHQLSEITEYMEKQVNRIISGRG